ncbi:MAG: hypothetical protein ACJ74U_10795 [Jatrophihabitantaceae bacterium]
MIYNIERNVMGDLVGPAETQYSDMKGTVACEPGIDGLELYGLFGLDSTTHTIVGIEAYNETGTTIVQAYVVDCPTDELQDRGGYAGLASNNGGNLPVTTYWLDTGEVGIGDFIDKHFKRFQIVAQDRHIEFPLEVTATRQRDGAGNWQDPEDR